MDPIIIDRVLSKTASTEEARQVAIWFSTDEGQEYFSQRYDRESYLLNEKIIEEWLDHEIPADQMKNRFLSQLNVRMRTFRFRVAAAVIIPFMLMAGAFTFVASRSGLFAGEDMAEFVVPCGEQLNVVLQDGTRVQLNSESRLQYPKTFGLFSRKVKLKGEAYFSVAKESTRPFEVDLNGIEIRVTGTHFNVEAYSDNNRIRIALEEGSVNIADNANHIYPLKIGQSADYDRLSRVCSIKEVSDMTLHTAWRTKSLNFYRTPLRDILKTLERQYEVQFSVKDSSLLNSKFSISTSKVNIDEIILDLQKVSRIKFVHDDNNNYIISAKN
jgi:transmembrane sensor